MAQPWSAPRSSPTNAGVLDAEGAALRAELLDIFAAGVAAPLDESRFNTLAMRVFAWQFEHNTTYAAYCRRRGAQPDTLSEWREVPAVPTEAFKAVPLVCGDPAHAEAVFRTSGTTRGAERRGSHFIQDLSVYRASLLAGFSGFVLADGMRMPILSLMPPAAQLTDSSLAYMIDAVMDAYGTGGSGHFADVRAGLDATGLRSALLRFSAAGTPVCLVGTTLAFAHFLAAMRDAGPLALAAGSRLMDTGGAKGSGRDVDAAAMRRDYSRWFGIPEQSCINEYGMTELCSQLYEVPRQEGAEVGGMLAPPWLRTIAVDPYTLEALPKGERGILRHHDLANLMSVAVVQTEDLGWETDRGCVLLGRVPGAMPRGCSIAADMLLTAARTEEP